MTNVKEKVAMRERLLEALRALRECCHPPLREALWPSWEQLNELDSAVVGLAIMDRKRPITALSPYWKGYEWVDKRRPEIRLLPRVKDLVERADRLLKLAGESGLARLRLKASTGVPQAQRLIEALQVVQEDASKAAKIEWQDYESLLDDNKPLRLPYGDSTPRDVRCYIRALQLIVDDLGDRLLRDQTLPLIVWIAGIGSPYTEMLKHDYRARYFADYLASRRTDEITKRKQDQWRLRKRRQRSKRLQAFLLAEGMSEAEVQKFLAANA